LGVREEERKEERRGERRKGKGREWGRGGEGRKRGWRTGKGKEN
jgi:hypothetical protein